MLTYELPIIEGDEVSIYRRNGKILITEPITKTGDYYTIRDLIETIHRGYNRVIKPDKRRKYGDPSIEILSYHHFKENYVSKNRTIYNDIGMFIDSDTRQELAMSSLKKPKPVYWLRLLRDMKKEN
jgi:hypothetical protein